MGSGVVWTPRHSIRSPGLEEESPVVLFRRFAARNPKTDPATLAQLARSSKIDVVVLVAQNPFSPTRTLNDLASSPDPQIRGAVARNPSLPPSTLRRLSHDPADPVLVAVAGNESTPAGTLDELARRASFEVKRAVAGNRATALSTRTKLLRIPQLREVALRTGSLESVAARVEAAQNGGADLHALLAYDPDEEVRRAVASAHHVGRKTLDILTKDGSHRVANVAVATRSRDASVLANLAATDDTLVLMALWQNPSTPDGVRSALVPRIPDAELLLASAQDESAPTGVLGQLAHHTDARVRLAVAKNPSTPPDAMDILAADAAVLVRSTAAASGGLSPDALTRLASDAESRVRIVVARHPSSPPAALRILAADAKVEIRSTAASLGALPLDALVRLATDADTTVRVAAAGNTSCPPEIHRRLAADPDPQVRAAVACNPSSPPEILQLLSTDPEPRVRATVADNASAPPGTLRLLAADEAMTNPTEKRDRYPSAYGWWKPSTPPDTVRAVVARNPLTPPDTLRWLAREGELHVAHNPSTPPDVLQLIGKTTRDESTLLAIGRHPATPLETLAALASDLSWVEDRYTTHAITERFDGVTLNLGSRDVLDRGATERAREYAAMVFGLSISRVRWRGAATEGDRLRIAESAWPDPDILAVLSTDESASVRRAVAANGNTPPEAFLQLTEDASPDVRVAAAGATHGPRYSGRDKDYVAAYERLTRDPLPQVRRAAVANPVFWKHLPPERRERLAFDLDPRVRTTLALAYIEHGPSEKLSEAALGHLVNKGDAKVWRALADSWLRLPPKVLSRLVQTGDSRTLISLVETAADRRGNSETTRKLLTRIARSSDPAVLTHLHAPWILAIPSVLTTLVRNPRLPSNLLADIAKITTDSDTLRSIASHPAASTEMLLDFARGDDERRLRAALLSPDHRVRENLAANPAAPADVITQLLDSGEDYVREKLLLNPSTPPELLLRLVEKPSGSQNAI